MLKENVDKLVASIVTSQHIAWCQLPHPIKLSYRGFLLLEIFSSYLSFPRRELYARW